MGKTKGNFSNKTVGEGILKDEWELEAREVKATNLQHYIPPFLVPAPGSWEPCGKAQRMTPWPLQKTCLPRNNRLAEHSVITLKTKGCSYYRVDW